MAGAMAPRPPARFDSTLGPRQEPEVLQKAQRNPPFDAGVFRNAAAIRPAADAYTGDADDSNADRTGMVVSGNNLRCLRSADLRLPFGHRPVRQPGLAGIRDLPHHVLPQR